MRTLLIPILCVMYFSSHAMGQTWCFQTGLMGINQNPPVSTASTGVARTTLTGGPGSRTLQFTLDYSGLGSGLQSAHIHGPGPVGVNAPILYNIVVPVNTTSGTLSGTWTSFSEDVVNFLLNGSLYFNLHTTVYPGGEIRGQILTTSCGSCYKASMTGSQQTPPAITPASGMAYGTLTGSPGNYTFTYAFTYTNLISPVLFAHIHGPASVGQSAGIVHDIIIDVGSLQGNVRGSWSSPSLSDSLVASLMDGLLYFNVHTTMYPSGEIRGQIYILDSCNSCYNSIISGTNQVPVLATNAIGTAMGFLTGGPQNWAFHYQLTYSGASTGVISAHIHGPANSTGNAGIIYAFKVTVGSKQGQLVGTWLGFSESLALEIMLARTYINIHTSAYPSGEIRGQLLKEACDCDNCTVCFGSSILTGAQASPPVNTLLGRAVASNLLFLNGNDTRLYYSLQFNQLSTPTLSAHIHKNLLGLNGPIVYTLNLPVGVRSGVSKGVWNSSNPTEPLNFNNFVSYLQTGLYYNVHTQTYPNGEIRSQVVPLGCVSGNRIVAGPNFGLGLFPKTPANPAQVPQSVSNPLISPMNSCIHYRTCESCNVAVGCSYCKSSQGGLCYPSVAQKICYLRDGHITYTCGKDD